MNTAGVLATLALAAGLGALAGGAVAVLGSGGGDLEVSDPLNERLTELTVQLDGLRADLKEARNANADVNERVIAAELELSRLRDVMQRRAAESGSVDGAGTGGASSPTVVGGGPPDVWASSPPAVLGSVPADAAKSVALAREKAEELRNRFRRSMELRALPEEQRWQRAADDLGLTSVQVDEIKRAKAVFDEAREAATTTEETEIAGGRMTVRKIDPKKMRAARQELESSVKNVLNSEQQDRWRNEGYEGALTGSGGVHAGTIFGKTVRGSIVGSGGRIVVETATDTESDDEE